MKSLRVCFIGSSFLGAGTLRWLLANQQSLNIEVVAMVGRRESRSSDDFVDIIQDVYDPQSAIIPYYWESKFITKELQTIINSANCDIGVCIGWNWLIPSDVLAAPKFGFIGYHPTLLPTNRGRHPVIWTIQLGLQKTGSTLFRLTDGIDDGPILSQTEFALDKRETATSLYMRLMSVVPKQLSEVITSEKYRPEFPGLRTPYSPSYWRGRSRNEGVIDWRISSIQIDAIVRALTWPYSGAEVWEPRLKRFSKVKYTEPVSSGQQLRMCTPGQILESDGSELLVACGDSTALWIREHSMLDEYAKGDSLV